MHVYVEMAGFPQWIIGVILIILGSLGNNLGSNLVSLGHKEKTEGESKKQASSKKTKSSDGKVAVTTDDAIEDQRIKEEDEPVGFGSSPRTKEPDMTLSAKQRKEEDEEAASMSWRIVGVLIFIFGNLFTFASFGFGAQSLIASLESIQFVSNLVFAKYCHNEIVTHRMIIATISIVVGNILVVIFAQHHAILYKSTGMIELYKTNTAYHIYLVFAFVLWAITDYTYRLYHKRRIEENKLMWKHNFMEPFCYSMSSAIVGTQAVLNSKCMSMLLQVTIRGQKNEFKSWYIYFIVITWVMLVSYWLNRLDKGFALFPPLFIIPVMQVFFVFFAILCGGIYFREFIEFTPGQWVGFIFGVSMILGGVYGLAPTDMVLQTPVNQIVPEDGNNTGEDNFLDFSKTANLLELENGTTGNASSASAAGIPGGESYTPKEVTPEPIRPFITPDRSNTESSEQQAPPPPPSMSVEMIKSNPLETAVIENGQTDSVPV